MRHVLRWIIPGLILVGQFALVQGLWIVIVQRGPLWPTITATQVPAVVVATAVAVALPAGFLVNRLYLRDYRAVGEFLPSNPWFRTRGFYRRDLGAEIMRLYLYRYGGRKRMIERVDQSGGDGEGLQARIGHVRIKRWFRFLMVPKLHLHPVPPATRATGVPVWRERLLLWRQAQPLYCAECERIYSDRFARNQALVRSLVDYGAGQERRTWIRTEYLNGTDLYHGIGAVRTAVSLGVLLASGSHVFGLGGVLPESPDTGFRMVLLACAVVCVAVGQCAALNACREIIAGIYETRVAAALAYVSKELDPSKSRD